MLATAAAGQLDWRQILGSSGDSYSRLWEEFCDELKKSGSAIEFYTPDDDELDRAEGYRFLSRILRLSLLSELEYYDPDRPIIWQSETPIRKFGGNNPDELYFDAFIDGDRSYRIRGQRGTTPLMATWTCRESAKAASMSSSGPFTWESGKHPATRSARPGAIG